MGKALIGIVVEDSGGELARLSIESAHQALSSANSDYVIFSQTTPICPFTKSLVPRFSIGEAANYNGILVTTSLNLLEICSSFPMAKIIHYLWAPDWESREYFNTKSLLMGTNGIVVRSPSHEKILLENFNIQSIGESYHPDFDYFSKLIEG